MAEPTTFRDILRALIPGADIPFQRRRRQELEGGHALLLALREAQGEGTHPDLQRIRDEQQASAARASQLVATQPGKEKIKRPFKAIGRYLADDEGQIDLTNVKTPEDARARILQLDNVRDIDKKVLLENVEMVQAQRGIDSLAEGLSKLSGRSAEDIKKNNLEQLQLMIQAANVYGFTGVEAQDGLYSFNPQTGKFNKEIEQDPNAGRRGGGFYPYSKFDPETGRLVESGFRGDVSLDPGILDTNAVARNNSARLARYEANLPFVASTVDGLQRLSDDIAKLGLSGWAGQGASYLSGVREQVRQVLGTKASQQLDMQIDRAFSTLPMSPLKKAASENAQLKATLYNVTMAIAQAQEPAAKSHAFEKIKLIMSSIMSDNLNDPNASLKSIQRMMQDITTKHRIEGRSLNRDSGKDISELLDPDIALRVGPLLSAGDGLSDTETPIGTIQVISGGKAKRWNGHKWEDF